MRRSWLLPVAGILLAALAAWSLRDLSVSRLALALPPSGPGLKVFAPPLAPELIRLRYEVDLRAFARQSGSMAGCAPGRGCRSWLSPTPRFLQAGRSAPRKRRRNTAAIS